MWKSELPSENAELYYSCYSYEYKTFLSYEKFAIKVEKVYVYTRIMTSQMFYHAAGKKINTYNKEIKS